MKKIKIISLATVALLAASPIASPLIVNAASTTQTSNVTTNSLYFVYNGKQLSDGSILPLQQGIPITDGESLEQILSDAKKIVSLNLSSAQIITKVGDVQGQLQAQGVLIHKGNIIEKIPEKGFYITLIAKEGNQTTSVKIPFGNAYTVTENTPEVQVDFNQNNITQKINVNNLVFQIPANSKFNPLEFVGTNGELFKLSSTNNGKISVDSNTVDTSKAGSLGTVKVATTNSANQKSTASFQVFVKPEGMRRLGIGSISAGWADGYKIINGKVVDGEQIDRGQSIYIGNDTQIIDNISYTKISTESQADANSSNNNAWVKTLDLAHENVEAVTKRVMHKALVYDSVGGTKVRKIPAFKLMTFESEPHIVRGVKYYKVIDRPDYIKASNIDGTKRTLKKNAYIYATSKLRASRTVLKKGEKITTYGGSYKFKNGKRYYRIEGATATNKRYVKVANFK